MTANDHEFQNDENSLKQAEFNFKWQVSRQLDKNDRSVQIMYTYFYDNKSQKQIPHKITSNFSKYETQRSPERYNSTSPHSTTWAKTCRRKHVLVPFRC